MKLAQILDQLRSSPNVTHWEVLPAREARWADFPPSLDPRLRQVLQKRGIERLYSHQAQAVSAVLEGENVVVVTPTASGKTLCYNLPVLDAILKDPTSRAIYLFPTKALAQDQLAELHALVEALEVDVKTYTYDGDTPGSARQAIRSAGHIVLTNPDMLHSGILPHHTKWLRLFESLKYVVIDEVHGYRGVFGSHLANVLRRLKRIARFYGSDPVFILASATIANPEEHAGRLLEEPVRAITENGSPRGEKHLVFWNPPVVNRQLGIRRGVLLEARRLARELLANHVQSIVFTRTRINVEVLLTYLRQDVPRLARRIRGYRGGYLPKERRAIEQGLRSGEVRGVVTTNALELGIDIGQLEAAVLAGYPGTIASTWQQAGRSGRRGDLSAAFLVASSAPLDQYIIQHPQFFLSRSPEHALINPDNLLILVNHLKCAAFELDFQPGERFGSDATEEILGYLAEEGLVLALSDGRWKWAAPRAYPAEEISLRTADADNFVIVDLSEGARVIGEVDRFAAPLFIHEGAIYIHEGRQYHIDRLDWERHKAYAQRVEVDYYTDAELAVDVRPIEEFEAREVGYARVSQGELAVTALPTIYKKIKLHTHENVGWGDIRLPQLELQTTSYWLAFSATAGRDFTPSALQGALQGLANVLGNVAPLYLMCDPRDLGVVAQTRSPHTEAPTLFLYEKVPGGIGFSEKLYQIHEDLLRASLDLVGGCPCLSGCPACVGPPTQVGEAAKTDAQLLARWAVDTLNERVPA